MTIEEAREFKPKRDAERKARQRGLVANHRLMTSPPNEYTQINEETA
jgi:hypothetical protein